MRRFSFLLVVMAGALSIGAGAALAASPPVNNALPTISGTARQGQTLTATNGQWGGASPIAYSYAWQRCNSSGSSCGAISRATSQNYVASSGDVGRTLRIEVTATNSDGKAQALSIATGTIAKPGTAPANTAQPNPAGTAQEGQTVTVNDGTWSGLAPISFSYQWQNCTAVNPVCTDINGATKSSFFIGVKHVGSVLRATITAKNSAGSAIAHSNLTSIVLAKATAPVSVSLPGISGSLAVGQRVQASTGVWSGATLNGFTFQWSRCNASGIGCAAIFGATGQTYGIGKADLGFAIVVSVKATNPTGSTTAVSAASVVRAPLTYRFAMTLRAAQEVRRPKGVSSSAIGQFTARLTGSTLSWTLTFSHLTGRPTVTYISKGVRAMNGVAFRAICRSCVSYAHGTFTVTASEKDAIVRGRAYVNIQTKKNPYGELRGQITRAS